MKTFSRSEKLHRCSLSLFLSISFCLVPPVSLCYIANRGERRSLHDGEGDDDDDGEPSHEYIEYKISYFIIKSHSTPSTVAVVVVVVVVVGGTM
uniref:Uncharacterized protein n=1 Tax=Anopheles darlingi TaxID=43151 RepID=A0A2M4DQU4_ANODA